MWKPGFQIFVSKTFSQWWKNQKVLKSKNLKNTQNTLYLTLCPCPITAGSEAYLIAILM